MVNNLQENIDRIKQMMGIMNEDLNSKLKRRLGVIDRAVNILADRYVKEKENHFFIKNEDEFMRYIRQTVTDIMYSNYFAKSLNDEELDDVWFSINDFVKDYINQNHKDRLLKIYRDNE